MSHFLIRIVGRVNMMHRDVLVARRAEINSEMAAKVGSATFSVPTSWPAR
jgi:hypothetical protein